MRRLLITLSLLTLLTGSSGCAGQIFGEITSWQPHGNPKRGLTYYVGGAGPMGNVGSFDVPGGLRDGGYAGDVRVFNWQSWLHSGDQLNIRRNRSKGMELADEIRTYRRQYPDAKVNIIALSAGTGIATFALEYLPESTPVDNVVFLGCSLSSRYDLTRALRRVHDKLYVVYSPTDGVLANVVWYTGTVDGSASEEGIAGLEGFYLPSTRNMEARNQYRKVVNIRYRPEFTLSDYRGGHIDCTSRLFIRRYIAPALISEDTRLVGHFRDRRFDRDAPAPKRPVNQPPRNREMEESDENANWADDIEYGGGFAHDR